MRAKGNAPPEGTVALKRAAALVGANYETSRRWCSRGFAPRALGRLALVRLTAGVGGRIGEATEVGGVTISLLSRQQLGCNSYLACIALCWMLEKTP